MIEYDNVIFYSSSKFIYHLKYKKHMIDDVIIKTLSEYYNISLLEANNYLEYFNEEHREDLLYGKNNI